MSTANKFFGTGGLDGSLQFELDNGENTGPGHGTTLKFLANYLSPRASMADLIAAGVYASVRSCGGPIVPVRGGRVDATSAGAIGVPQPQNGVGTFKTQFDRMGFSVAEMIQVTACGHTLGGVHTTEFPDIVPAGSTANGEAPLDASVASFDNKVVTEYLSNTTTNPLVVGPVVGKRSDLAVFAADGNVTMRALSDATAFQNTCKTVLQKMIDVVPAGVVLTDPITPYTVKPVNMQLTLNSPGATMLLNGYIRVRRNGLPSDVTSIKLTYKDRSGGNNCGTCATTATGGGTATGFDDQFVFFPINTNIDVATGISSFTITLSLASGTSQVFDNNGNSYPVSDAVLIQKPQSCLLQGSGALTVQALVRNDRTSLPVNLGVSYLVPRNTKDGNPVPALNNASIAMTKGDCFGQYTFYSASYTIPGGQSYNAKLDILSGSGADVVSDSFNDASDLAGSCISFTGGVACGGSAGPSTTSSSAVSPTVSSTASVTKSSTISSTGSSTSSSVAPVQTLSHRSQIGGYNLVSCWMEATGARALKDATFAYDGMTLESCAANCTGFAYWGTEYGRECYCGNSLDSTSTSAPLADCNMVCGGNANEYCGAGSRLELYLTSASKLPSSTSTTLSTSVTKTSSSSTVTSSSVSPTGTLGIKATVGKYAFVGCQTEGTGVRALSANSYASDAMTLESCADFCAAYTYFGTEYGRECYCGNTIDGSSTTAPLSDCSMICAGSAVEYCGAGSRLELYSVAATSASSQMASSTTISSSISSSTTNPPTTSKSTSTTSTPNSLESTASSVTSSASTTGPSSTSITPTIRTSTTTPPSSTTSASTSTSSTSTTPTTLGHLPTISPFTLLGCYTEALSSRALTGPSYSDSSNSLSLCASFCSSYRYFGTEYSSECYCGNTLDSTSLPAPLADCSMTCSGNPLQYCGAGNRLELYINNATTTTLSPSPPSPSQKAVVSGAAGASWGFKSCCTEATDSRALTGASYADDEMTLESCARFCSAWGYFGTEYGRECYCGNGFGAGSVVTDGKECGMGCAGDAGELCGAAGRLSVYAKQLAG